MFNDDFSDNDYLPKKKGKYKRILLVATGALMSPVMMNQKLTIPSISHAVSVEVLWYILIHLFFVVLFV